MTEQKLDEITTRVCDIFRHTEFYEFRKWKEADDGIHSEGEA